MNDEIFMNCIDYVSMCGGTFLEAFEKLYSGSDMPDDEYEAIFDYIEANLGDYLCL